MSVVVVDTPERIAAGAAVIAEVVDGRGVITTESVPGAVWVDDGVRRGAL